MDPKLLLLGCTFGAVTLIAYLASMLLLRSGEDRALRSRLTGLETEAPAEEGKSRFVSLFDRVSQAAAKPFMPKSREKQSALRRDLGYAGIYSPSAIKLMTACKFICLIAGLGCGYLLDWMMGTSMLALPLGGIIGYLAPRLWMRLAVKSNQKALNYGLPDALDLMVVCVEAGLTIDAAMQRVGQEMQIAHPCVSRELSIAHMETRVGLSRAESLKNLGTRTGSTAFQSLAAMLVQADRFGTSIASALRVHAESLRANRQHAAEELAAKASVKMSFPLVLFIFPATFIVLAGPTVIGLMNSALFQ
ncbi:MAG: type II secretion system F family protein [Phycisphaerales bacterium]|nr:type II secretion system F family protein [Phycisphaerales bacterium]